MKKLLRGVLAQETLLHVVGTWVGVYKSRYVRYLCIPRLLLLQCRSNVCICSSLSKWVPNNAEVRSYHAFGYFDRLIYFGCPVEPAQLRRIRKTREARTSSRYSVINHTLQHRRPTHQLRYNKIGGASEQRQTALKSLNSYAGTARAQKDHKPFIRSPLSALPTTSTSIVTSTAPETSNFAALEASTSTPPEASASTPKDSTLSLSVDSEADNRSVRRNRLKRSYAMFRTSLYIYLSPLQLIPDMKLWTELYEEDFLGRTSK